MIYDFFHLIVGPLPLDVAKSIWVSVDFPHHASCNANQPSRMKSNFPTVHKVNLSNYNYQGIQPL